MAHGQSKRSKGAVFEWKNLQLPLYAHMVRELLVEDCASPVLGYFNLPGDGSPATVRTVTWTDEIIDGALEKAREIIREMRTAPRFGDMGKVNTRHLDPIEAELFGVGLVFAPSSGEPSGSESTDRGQG